MSFNLPPIVKLAEGVLLETERAVRQFPRYHKYQHGATLRRQAMRVAQLAHRAWRHRAQQARWTARLAVAIDNFKLSLQLGQQIQAFRSFAQFEALARQVADLGRQCGGWLKEQRKGQNERAAPDRSPQILSARGASIGATP